MTDMLSFLKKYYKNILYVLLGFIVIYFLISILTPKPQMPAEYKAIIDSLTTVNKQLIERQKQIDSSINVYEEQVKQIDFQIDNIKEKTTIVREYYHEVGQQAAQYSPTQVDSFFKARYKY